MSIQAIQNAGHIVAETCLDIASGDAVQFKALPAAKKAAVLGLRALGASLFVAGIVVGIGTPIYLVTRSIGLIQANAPLVTKVSLAWLYAAAAYFKTVAEIAAGCGPDVGGFVFIFLGGFGAVAFTLPLLVPMIPGALISTAGGGLIATADELRERWSAKGALEPSEHLIDSIDP